MRGGAVIVKIRSVKAVCFSPSSHTHTVVVSSARKISEFLNVPVEEIDFTLPSAREKDYHFPQDELIVFGVPTYAGRIPNKILPIVRKMFRGDHSPAIALVTFGNRNYDSSLTELRDELINLGFQVFAAGAFVCEHVFSEKIGTGRPDEKDYALMDTMAEQCAAILNQYDEPAGVSRLPVPVIGKDEPVKPYYTPLKADGSPAVFLKAKPVTDLALCDRCGICIKACPMGSIDPDDPAVIPGICIKCQACIRKCPKGAKSILHPDYLSHVQMLEKNYTGRAKSEFYIQ